MYGFTTLIVVAFSLIDITTACGGCLQGTRLARQALENKRNVVGRSAAGPVDYTYTTGSTNGPEQWGSLDPSYASCANGTKQTPINVDCKKAVAGSNMKLTIAKQASAKIEFYDHTLQVTTTGTFVNAGKTYNILQYHFHDPSEHQFNGKSYPMEVHFVGQASDGSLSVAGFMIAAGKGDTFLEGTFSNIASLKADGDITTTGALDCSAISVSLSKNKVFTYEGSLTTPPCSEGVAWVLSMTPLTMNAKTLAAVKKVMGTNNRPLQKNPASM